MHIVPTVLSVGSIPSPSPLLANIPGFLEGRLVFYPGRLV